MSNAAFYALAYVWLGVATTGFCSWAHKKTEGHYYGFAPLVMTFAAWPLAWVIICGMVWIQYKESGKKGGAK